MRKSIHELTHLRINEFNSQLSIILSEEAAEGLLDDADPYDLNVVFVLFEVAEVVFGDEDALEPESRSLGYAVFNAADGAHLAAEPQLGSKAVAGGDGHVDVAGEDAAGHGKVEGGVAHAQPSRHVEEDILGPEFESAPFLEDSQQHVHTPHVETVGVALGGAVDGRADERLHFDEHVPPRRCR